MVDEYSENAWTLHELCEQREESLHEIILHCVFCREELCRQEVYDFARFELRLVYREGTAYGVCKPCLQLHSKVRRLRHYNCSVYGSTLEGLLKKQLHEVTIRCYICQKPLCQVEMQRHLDCEERFHEIAGVWTGRCIPCWRPAGAETTV
ncbi:E6 [Macaca fascicularis papillomavirus 7]|uniref:Protein E6 n=1 Tax=Macaca fascicularis papillomavirus 7 TaxID=471185 RepID=C3PU64_RHPV1|nr:E6 [Macaca fascicularis papillomavirus 7]